MAYVRATLAEFQAVFTAFPNVQQATYDYWVVRAERLIDSAFGDDQLHATMLLTAHYLVMQGFGSEVDSQRWSKFAGATRVKSGSLELSWSDGLKTTGSRYGDEVRDLIVSNKGGPHVAGTGTWPVYPDYGAPYGNA